MVDFLVITSNAPHAFQELIEETSGRKVISMISVTLDEVRKRGWRRVGVVGFGEPAVYIAPLVEMGIACDILSGEEGGLRDKVDQAVIALMEGRIGPEANALALEAVNTLRERGVARIILGCTEIPLLMGDAAQAPDLLNPLELLAEAAVRFAMDD
jgi:aspartate racemase